MFKAHGLKAGTEYKFQLSASSADGESKLGDPLFIRTLKDPLGNSICEAFDNENVVVTPTLRSDVFTTAAMDNIDHNPSSTTADKSLHDTAISLFQQPRGSNTFEDYFNDILMPYIHDQLRFVSRLEVVGD
ncbi:Hypothetical predicted protein [Mytilus galloprovincialis]|uniref:Fibronectin type-III domain-containing protein n=1 Tax=Mytilus galloprovincialis TaxID=29158 RepID=A0A8B6BGC0_MYTGA|nr:Hypothetical predicted protein [Mytilus galloprovincialis]